jgi:hypothetical protein
MEDDLLWILANHRSPPNPLIGAFLVWGDEMVNRINGGAHDLRYLTGQRRSSIIVITRGERGRNSWQRSGFAGAPQPPAPFCFAVLPMTYLNHRGYVRKARCPRSVASVPSMQSRVGLSKAASTGAFGAVRCWASSMSRPLSFVAGSPAKKKKKLFACRPTRLTFVMRSSFLPRSTRV